MSKGDTSLCCFSPDERLIAASADNLAYVWDVTSTDLYPVEVFIGHTDVITALAFSSSSSLISASNDWSVKFWQIGTSTADPVEIGSESTIHPPAQVISITLQAADGITTTSGLYGMVRVWNIFTGQCQGSFQTPVKDLHKRSVQLIDNRLILVWHMENKIHIWDVEKQEPLITTPSEVARSQSSIEDLKISGDGSAVFYLNGEFIEYWSIWTVSGLQQTTYWHQRFRV